MIEDSAPAILAIRIILKQLPYGVELERGHPVRLSAQREYHLEAALPTRSKRASPAGGQGVRDPLHEIQSAAKVGALQNLQVAALIPLTYNLSAVSFLREKANRCHI